MKLSWFLFHRDFDLRMSFSELSHSLVKYRDHKKIDIEQMNEDRIEFDYLFKGVGSWNWHICVERSRCTEDLVQATFKPPLHVIVPIISWIAVPLLAVLQMDVSWLWVPAVFFVGYTISQLTTTFRLRSAIADVEQMVEHWRKRFL